MDGYDVEFWTLLYNFADQSFAAIVKVPMTRQTRVKRSESRRAAAAAGEATADSNNQQHQQQPRAVGWP